MTIPILDGRHWLGSCENRWCFHLAAMWEVCEDNGFRYYHYALYNGLKQSLVATKKPIRSDYALPDMEELAKDERLSFVDFKWHEVELKNIPFNIKGFKEGDS